MKKILLIVFALIFGMSMNAQDKKENVNFKPTIKFNGRVQYDFEFITPTYDGQTDAEKAEAKFNGNEFRRAYLSAKGKIGKKLGYKLEVELAGGEVAYRDVYISYDAGKAGKFAVGSMAEPTGLNMSTSSKYITFMERSMLTAFQNFRWGAGFHYANYKIADDFALQMSLTNNGSHKAGFKDTKLEEGMNFAARATYAVINNKENNSLVHLGVNFDSRQAAHVKLHPENHMGSSYHLLQVSVPDLDNPGEFKMVDLTANKRSDLGFELATNFGPLSIQGEYKMNSNDIDSLDKTYKINTFYAFASYFITGEHRPYKHGTFGRVKPKHDVDNGGFGALEVAARYSAVDNSDYVTIGSYDGLNNITLGLNWYLNSHARVMYNAVLTDFNGTNGEKQTAHMIRFAVDF